MPARNEEKKKKDSSERRKIQKEHVYYPNL